MVQKDRNPPRGRCFTPAPLVSQALGRVRQISKDSRMTVVIVEQKVREVLKIARRVYVLRMGRVSFSGPADALKDDAKLREVYL